MRTIIFVAITMLLSFSAFAQKATEKEPQTTEKTGSIVFKSLVYDYGTMNYGDEAIAVFEMKNITKSPIKLTNVKTSCGCTGAEWPREEIAKKKKAKITVTYNSKNVGKFEKNIYVYVENQADPIQLTIKGEVLPQENSVIQENGKTETSPQKNEKSNATKSVTKENTMIQKDIQVKEKSNIDSKTDVKTK
jgi:hypothetical protein